MRGTLLGILLSLLLASPAWAAVLEGRLLGSEGKPLSYGVITLIDADGEERVTLSRPDSQIIRQRIKELAFDDSGPNRASCRFRSPVRCW